MLTRVTCVHTHIIGVETWHVMERVSLVASKDGRQG